MTSFSDPLVVTGGDLLDLEGVGGCLREEMRRICNESS